MNINSHLNETNVVISLRVSITNHLKLVRIYLRNPVGDILGLDEDDRGTVSDSNIGITIGITGIWIILEIQGCADKSIQVSNGW